MAQVYKRIRNITAGHSSFELPFEDAPLIWSMNGSVRTAGAIDGAVEVTYYDCGEWWISDVWVATDSPHGQQFINLSPQNEPDLRTMVIDSAVAKLNGTIEKTVREIIAYEFSEAA